MKRIFIFLSCLTATVAIGQDLSFSKPGNQFYTELPNPVKTDEASWKKVKADINVSFASDNVKYPKEKVPGIVAKNSWTGSAWKGEKVHTQLLLWTKKNLPVVSFQVSDLVDSKGNRIPAKNVKAAFVRYTMADNFVDGCSQKSTSRYDSFLVADPIDIVSEIPVVANTVQPIWLSVDVPSNIIEGKYNGTLTVNASGRHVMKITLEVLNQVLPPPAQWKYDFDIWQYPAPIARMHNVPLWSEEHFNLMKEYFTYLANAGQKVISANIIEQPWGLDHVHFDDPNLRT